MKLEDLTNTPLPTLRPREADDHKGDFGRALLVGGSRGMSGAISLSGQAALRSGAGLVYLDAIDTKDFSLIDLATKKSRKITNLSDRGYLTTFDITPDGKYLVFDRSRQNSDIVLIDLPKK